MAKIKYISPINPHAHLRGTEYSQPFMEWGIEDAIKVGLCHIIEMPNPTPNLVEKEVIQNRSLEGAKLTKGRIGHSIHPGITNDPQQVVRILEEVISNQGLVSDKAYYAYSTGGMNLTNLDIQRWIWQKKGAMAYSGVSLGHFEDEALWKLPYDPQNPVTHSLRQTEESELVQVERQFKWAYDYDFVGTFYVCHCSSPSTVAFLHKMRETKKLPFGIVIEATWHHLFLNYDDYNIHGNLVKMNPPLRSPSSQASLLECCLKGEIGVIGDDHAPHPLEKKLDPFSPASGVPALPFWPKGIELLRKYGMKEPLLEDLLFINSNHIFGLQLPKKEVEVEYDPSLWVKYGYNPFSRIDH